MAKKLRLKIPKESAITINRRACAAKKICYIVTANKSVRYPHRRSTIVYVGTSERGIVRMMETARDRAAHLLDTHGISELCFHVVRCSSKQNVTSWASLERAILLYFKRLYGRPPIDNKKGKGNVEKWQKDLDRFAEASIKKLLLAYE